MRTHGNGDDCAAALSEARLDCSSTISLPCTRRLVTAFPDASGAPLRIQLDCVATPTESVQLIIEHTRPRLDEHNIGFVVNVLR